jgi:hypothetical protein
LKFCVAATALVCACALAGVLAFAGTDAGRAAVRPGAAPDRKTLDQKTKGDWTPPDPDAPIATLDPAASCDLEELLTHTGERTKEMADSLQSFTARETVRYEQLDNLGLPTMADRAQFEYAVGFEQRGGGLKVTEARSPVAAGGAASLPQGFQGSGLAALALIFHPYYQDDYEMRCEGAAEENGRRVWVIHFDQRKDKRPRTRGFRTDQGAYPARLKGRAWISAELKQVVRIETGLVAGIGMIHLVSDAVTVEYAPVQFSSKGLTLWLPKMSEVYTDFQSYKLVVKESFSDYLLSSVETQQVISKPSTKD